MATEREKRDKARKSLTSCSVPGCTRKITGGLSKLCVVHEVTPEFIEKVKAATFILNEGKPEPSPKPEKKTGGK